MLHAVIIDASYSTNQQEILSLNRKHPAESTILHNRIMAIIERFFTGLYEQRKQLKYQEKILRQILMPSLPWK